jgi:hypothetical protein
VQYPDKAERRKHSTRQAEKSEAQKIESRKGIDQNKKRDAILITATI